VWDRWWPHWRQTASAFAGYPVQHEDDVLWGRAPTASAALRASVAALTPSRRTSERAQRALHESGHELAWLVCDAFYARNESPGDPSDWLLDLVEAFDAEPGLGARPMVETAARRASLEALSAIAARYDLSKSRGRTMRPVAPGIANDMLYSAAEELLELAAAAARLTFDRGR
jgi:hypothetical protein